MPITVNSLFNDSLNFMRNQLAKFLMLAFLAVVIHLLLAQAFQADFKTIDETYQTNFTEIASPSGDQQDMAILQAMTDSYQSLPPEQQTNLLKDLIIQLLIIATPPLLTKLLLVTWCISLAILVINGENASFSQIILQSLSKLPKMILISYLCFILTLIGSVLLIVPGVILFFGLKLAPIIIAASNSKISAAISQSFNLLLRYPAAVIQGALFALAFSILAVTIITTLVLPITSVFITIFISHFADCLIISFFTLYYFRLLSLSQVTN